MELDLSKVVNTGQSVVVRQNNSLFVVKWRDEGGGDDGVVVETIPATPTDD